MALSQLLGEFSWLTEETLLRGFDVGFSGQLRGLVQHTLGLLRAHVVLLRVQRGDLMVVPRPGPGQVYLARLSAELLPAFLSEAVGGECPGIGGWQAFRERGAAPTSQGPSPPACAVRGLLARRVPPEGPWELQGVQLLSQKELYHQVLLLLHLLPRDLLLLQVRLPWDPASAPARWPAPPLPMLSGRHPPSCPAQTWSPGATQVPLFLSPASLPTATVRRCWTGSSSAGSWLPRR